jgi:hypothetical protein
LITTFCILLGNPASNLSRSGWASFLGIEWQGINCGSPKPTFEYSPRRASMKSRSLITLAAVVALASVTGYAQSSGIRVSVPFEFAVGQAVFPAGDYTVRAATSAGLVRLQAANPSSGGYVHANRAVRDNTQEQPTMVFNRYGNNYFLARIWWAASADGLEFPRTKTEIELAKTAGVRRPEQVTLVASR